MYASLVDRRAMTTDQFNADLGRLTIDDEGRYSCRDQLTIPECCFGGNNSSGLFLYAPLLSLGVAGAVTMGCYFRSCDQGSLLVFPTVSLFFAVIALAVNVSAKSCNKPEARLPLYELEHVNPRTNQGRVVSVDCRLKTGAAIAVAAAILSISNFYLCYCPK